MGAHRNSQTPCWIEWPSAIKWQPTIRLVPPTIKNLTETPVNMFISTVSTYFFHVFELFAILQVKHNTGMCQIWAVELRLKLVKVSCSCSGHFPCNAFICIFLFRGEFHPMDCLLKFGCVYYAHCHASSIKIKAN